MQVPDVLSQVCIEGIPFIIRFKTPITCLLQNVTIRIEGIPFIIRFKTEAFKAAVKDAMRGIEGIPFIIRFKTFYHTFE